ncbi:MAG: alpha/beta fold hydrolase [Deltaproteobacteria bacterium]|nr:alpha/beta fold hydrolase [Deltaproteobacteria bacterium]
MTALMDIVDSAAVALVRARGARSAFLDGDGSPVHVLRAAGRGHAPPVLLLHGLGSQASDYIAVIAGLLPHVSEVLALDLPGHGLSPAPPGGMCPTAMRRVTLAAVDQLLERPVVVFGNSLGGLTAVRLALLRPDRVLGLMLASPAGAPMSDEEFSNLLAGFEYPDHDAALRFVDRFTRASPVVRHSFAWGVRQRMSRAAIRDLLGRIGPGDLLAAEDLAALDVPVHVVWGALDRILPATHADFFRDSLPSGAVVEIDERAGHAPYLDDPLGFPRAIARFAARCAA